MGRGFLLHKNKDIVNTCIHSYFSRYTYLTCSLSIDTYPFIVYESCEGSGETACRCRIVLAFVDHPQAYL